MVQLLHSTSGSRSHNYRTTAFFQHPPDHSTQHIQACPVAGGHAPPAGARFCAQLASCAPHNPGSRPWAPWLVVAVSNAGWHYLQQCTNPLSGVCSSCKILTNNEKSAFSQGMQNLDRQLLPIDLGQ
jgi:hypothetical protein